MVQINMDESCKLDIKLQIINHICDDPSRWWLLWYEYTLNTNNIPVYGARILLGPNRKLNIKNIFFGQILFIYLIHLVISMDLLTSSLVPILLNSTNILLYVIGNFFSLLVLFSVLFILFSLTSPFLQLLKFQKGNGTIPSTHDRIYITSFLVLLFIAK